MTPASTSLLEGFKALGAGNFLLDARLRKTRRPKKPESGETRSQRPLLRSPRAAASSVGKRARLVLIRCSKHCPTLQRSAEGFQLSCDADRLPKSLCASSATAFNSSRRPPSSPFAGFVLISNTPHLKG